MKKLTQSQRVYVAVLGLALAGLTLDRVLFSPQPASADDALPAAPTVAPVPPFATVRAGPVTDVVVPERHLAARFDELAKTHGIDPLDVRDPFRIPAHWLPDEAPVIEVPTADLAPSERFVKTHTLNAVMANGAHGYAIVDGTRLRLGQRLDGFRLVEVRPRSIVLESDGVTVKLSLSDAGGPGGPE